MTLPHHCIKSLGSVLPCANYEFIHGAGVQFIEKEMSKVGGCYLLCINHPLPVFPLYLRFTPVPLHVLLKIPQCGAALYPACKARILVLVFWKQDFMKKISVFTFFILMIACNNASESIPVNPADTTAVGTDSIAPVPVDTATFNPVDSIAPTPTEVTKFRKSANIAYSYFNTIKRNEVKHIMAYLSINKPEARVRDTLRQIERTETVNSTDDDSSIINSLHIPLVYEHVEISLEDPAGDYDIKPVGHASNKQRIDTIRGNKWDWSILTKTDKPSTTLILKITAYLPDSTEELENRKIPIRIKLEQNMIRKLWAALLDDPKYFLTVILVPVIGYLGKKYFDKKKAAKQENTPV
jgi:hypothetical protein